MAEHAEMVPAVDDGGDQKRGLTRRTFVSAMGFATLALFPTVRLSGQDKKAILVNSKGVLYHDLNRCVQCRLCELACTALNDGAASSYHARVKLQRNMKNVSPHRDNGFNVAADYCKQCAHPIPCAEACPVGAIVADSATGARKIDQAKCIGCGICNAACPWEMPTLNPATGKSSKCFLCDGKPQCARVCPTGALRYLPWRDLTKSVAVVRSGWIPATTATDCSTCHN